MSVHHLVSKPSSSQALTTDRRAHAGKRQNDTTTTAERKSEGSVGRGMIQDRDVHVCVTMSIGRKLC